MSGLRKPGAGNFNLSLQSRWLMWIFLVLLHLVTSFHRVSFNVVADLLTAEFGLTGAGLGNLAAAYTYMYVLMQIPGGVLVDRLEPRRVAVITGLAMAAGSILIGLAPGAGSVFVGRMLIGLGGSVVLINIFKFQAAWFRTDEFATMSGLAILFSTSGFLLAATPLALLVGMAGWRPPFVGAGLFTLAAAAMCGFFVRNKPELNTGPISTGAKPEPAELPPPSFFRALTGALQNRRLWLLFLVNTGTYGGFMVFAGTWGISYLVHVYRISVAEASVFMIMAYLGYMIGAPAIGFISDRLGSRKIPAVILVGLFSISWGIIAFWPEGPVPLSLVYVLSPVLGFGTAGSLLTFPMAREVSPPGFTGTVTAVVNLGIFLGLAVLQPLFGYVLDLGWEGIILEGARIYPLEAYRFGFLVCFLFAAVAFTAALFFRENKRAPADSA